MTDEEREEGSALGPQHRRIEGIALWAIPGIDPYAPDDELPDRIPDHALEKMEKIDTEGIRERRREGPN